MMDTLSRHLELITDNLQAWLQSLTPPNNIYMPLIYIKLVFNQKSNAEYLVRWAATGGVCGSNDVMSVQSGNTYLNSLNIPQINM